MQCSGCPQQVEVPPTLFDWECTVSSRTDRANALPPCRLVERIQLAGTDAPACSLLPLLFPLRAQNKHSNDRNQTVCAVCNQQKPKTVTPPAVVCAHCQTSTVVPSSTAGMHLTNAASNTKKFAVSTSTAAKEQIKYLSSAPETFHWSAKQTATRHSERNCV